MGTNFYRISTEEEMIKRKEKLVSKIEQLIFHPSVIEREYSVIPDPDKQWHTLSPWDEFIKDTSIHLGKRSGGWRFVWNFHKNRFYSNKEELFAFIRSGRVVDEYGTELTPDEFIEMAINWCPDGMDTQSYYEKYPSPYISSEHYDLIIDGLRVSSSTDFS